MGGPGDACVSSATPTTRRSRHGKNALDAAAVDPSPTQLAHCAAVHIAEAVAFGAEYFLYGSGGVPFIVFMVMLNAILFTAVAVRGI